METISACTHHGFDTWMLVNHFYGGMSPAMKQLLETMCGGDFLSKHPDEAMDFLNYVAETSKGWDEPNPREVEKMRPSAHQRGGIFAFSEDMEMKAKISTLSRKVEELQGKWLHEVQTVTENPAQANPCINFQSTVHPEEHCPIAPSVRDLMSEHANVVGQYKPQPNAPYGNTYNSNWKNHPNLSLKPNPSAYVPPGAKQQFGSSSQPQPSPFSSPVEQAILNLSKVVGNFVEEQKGINVQLAQIIDTVESNLNKRIDGLESSLNQKIDNLQYTATRITNLLEVQEKGRFPSQTLSNPKGVHEIGSSSNSRMDEVKSIITLRSGKEIEKPVPRTAQETEKEKEAEPKRIIIREDSMKKNMPPQFPQALRGKKKKIPNQAEIWEVLRQVKVNIPLLDMIKQVPTYVKFLKDLCTDKKGLGIEKKAFLTEQISAIIQSKTPMKYKDPGSTTISANIGGTCIDKALLDLGASVNLLPYSVYKQLGLGELKPTNMTLSLDDRSVKIPKGIVEDVLVKVDKFYYPVDFVVLDTEPIASGPNHVPIILGRPFLATSNAIINCRNGVMQLTFGNMTLELNIFHLSNKHKLAADDMQGSEEVCSISPSAGKPKAHICRQNWCRKMKQLVENGLHQSLLQSQ